MCVLGEGRKGEERLLIQTESVYKQRKRQLKKVLITHSEFKSGTPFYVSGMRALSRKIVCTAEVLIRGRTVISTWETTLTVFEMVMVS